MELTLWQELKQNVLETVAFIKDLDDRATLVLEEGAALVWEDLRRLASETFGS